MAEDRNNDNNNNNNKIDNNNDNDNNKTIKDGDIAPWKDLKGFEQR